MSYQNILIFQSMGRSGKCKFKEQSLENDYIQYQSLIQARWFVGFRKSGTSLPGHAIRNRKKQSCFQFLKDNAADLTHVEDENHTSSNGRHTGHVIYPFRNRRTRGLT